MSKVLAVQLGEHRIRVNCISPSSIVTLIFWGGHQTQSDEENDIRAQRLSEFFDETTGLKRTGTPENIAYAALYLASDESLHTTGLNMLVDTGLTCHSRPWRDIVSRAETRAKLLEGG